MPRQTAATHIALAAVLAAAPAHAQDAPAAITVQTTHTLGRVNPLVFGSNIEAGDTKNIFADVTNTALTQTGNGYWDAARRRPTPAVVQASRQAGVTLLRYPGGCLAHNFDWKKTVGPLTARPHWHFGLDEYLTVCRQTDAQPLITVSDYSGTPQDAADLVQYLNAPANPKHPWAMKRAQWGHPQPYHVRWFELGNESNHGNHSMTPRRQFTPQQYADYALATARAMRSIDPTIKIGIVSAAGMPPDDPWNAAVFAGAGAVADFLVVHTYAVNDTGANPSVPEDTRMQACLAADDQLEQALRDYHAVLKQSAGRDLPLAVTEYNAAFLGDTPKPYRYSLGAALFSADYVRVLLKPENNVLMANYWHFLNGYWGMVQGTDAAPRPQAAWALFRLWHEHFGAQLVAADVQSPLIDFAGYGLTQRAQGDRLLPGHSLGAANIADPQTFAPVQTDAVRSQVAPDGTLTFQFQSAPLPQFPNLQTVATPAGAGAGGCRYHLTFEARWTPGANGAAAQVGMGLMDARGYAATSSAIAVSGLENARDWTPFAGTYAALPDASGVILLARAEGTGTLSGRLEVRNIRLSAATNTVFPGYPALTSSASLSPDGHTAYVIVFNKTLAQDLPATLTLPGFRARSARFWTVNGPSLGSDNLKDNLVRETHSAAPLPLSPDGAARAVFPAHSMTAVEFYQAGVTPPPAAPPPAAPSSPVVYRNDFEGADALPPGGAVGDGHVDLAPGYQKTQSLRVERAAMSGAGAALVRLALPLDRLRGQTVTFSAQVKAQGVTDPPHPWNGVKVTLHIVSPSGEQWLQQNNVAGTFDWKSIALTAPIPPGVTQAELFLGLEAVTGRALFDAVRVSVAP